MNRNDFINMIGDVVPVNRQMIGEVYELIDIFPYFQSAHLLLLKGLQNNSDVKFENQLRNSAIHIADREVLYYLLKTKTSTAAEPVEVIQDRTSSENTVSDTQQTVIESAKNSDLLELDLDENEPIGPEDFRIATVQAEAEKITSEKQLQAGLIDKFIFSNPRIEPTKEKTNLPVEDISNPFFEVEEVFVTETLARIYINQGYFSKAIDIYEKLSLKFPEKSSYFASQIEKVKEYLKK